MNSKNYKILWRQISHDKDQQFGFKFEILIQKRGSSIYQISYPNKAPYPNSFDLRPDWRLVHSDIIQLP